MKTIATRRQLLAPVLLWCAMAGSAQADKIDDYLKAEMAKVAFPVYL